MKKSVFFLFISLIFTSLAYPQLAIRHQIASPKAADSLDIFYYSQKRGIRAGAMAFGVNMGVWAFDRYIRKADFAYIDMHTIKENIKHGFVWDNDAMGTNMFMHPYHGSLYFNAIPPIGVAMISLAEGYSHSINISHMKLPPKAYKPDCQ